MQRRFLLRAAPLALPWVAARSAAAEEVPKVRIALQFGITYLPLLVMREHRLLEKHAQAAGLPTPEVVWLQMSGGAAMNDALLSGSLDFASAGTPPVVLLWARTRNSLRVRAVAALSATPFWLNTNRSGVTNLQDFGERDRIAVPSVRVSFQAIVLQMAVEQAFGAGQYARLDPLTVALPHPDALVQLLGGRTEITGHFANPPFQNQEVQQPGIRRVTSSYEVTGGPHSATLVYATSKFAETNPKTLQAFLAALDEANAWIDADRHAAAELYIRAERSRLDLAFVEQLLNDPEHQFTSTPKATRQFADFQARIGQIKEPVSDWRDLFFPCSMTVPEVSNAAIWGRNCLVMFGHRRSGEAAAAGAARWFQAAGDRSSTAARLPAGCDTAF